MPEGDLLKKIRQEIDYNATDLKKIIDEPEFRKMFGNFRDQEQLKTAPQGYAADNENIDLLRLKSFVVMHNVTDKFLMKDDAPERLADIGAKIYPLNVFLRNALA
jgi:uncharacterized protein (TIGR02453 family)